MQLRHAASARCLSLLPLVLLIAPVAARAAWVPNGTRVSGLPSNPPAPAIAPDGSGGVLIVWTEPGGASGDDVFAQRLDADGNPLWGPGGVSVCDTTGYQGEPAVVSDGAGGAIVVWSDGRNGASGSPLYVQRISADGVPQWTSQGVRLSGADAFQQSPVMVADGSGGAVVVWMDTRFGDYDIMAQRVDASGDATWGLGDRIVCFETDRQAAPQVVLDGAGGTIVAWMDGRNGGSQGNYDIYAVKLLGTGLFVWAQNGVPLCSNTDLQANPQLVSDGAAGAIVVWEDYRAAGGPDLYAQRISDLGSPQWTADGIPVAAAAYSQEAPQVAPDGSGGIFLVWHDYRSGSSFDIYAQHMSAAGSASWTPDGLPVCTAPGNQLNPRGVADGSGGLVLAWGDGRSSSYSDIYVDRIRSDGSAASGGNGLPLAVAAYDQQLPRLVGDAAGGALVVWEDKRQTGAFAQVYAERFLISTTAVGDREIRSRTGVLAATPNPFRGATEIQFTWPEGIPGSADAVGPARFEVFDSNGRDVFDRDLGVLGAGMHRVRFEGRDHAGRKLPSGIYFARVTGPGVSWAGRIVLRN